MTDPSESSRGAPQGFGADRTQAVRDSLQQSHYAAFVQNISDPCPLVLSAVGLGILLCGIVLLAVVPLLWIGFDFGGIYSEGWNVYHAAGAAAGQVLYSGDLRRLVNYPFLSFYIVAWLKPILGDELVIGRALSLLALTAVTFGSALVVRQLGGGRIAAAFAALCVLGFQIIQAPAWIGADDPQMLAEALMIWGLACYLRDRRTLCSLGASALLFGLGCFTKHNVVAIPVAVALDLLWWDRRRFCLWAGFFGLVCAMLLGATYAVAGGDFLHELLASRVITLHHLYDLPRKFAITFKLPLLIAILYLARPLPRDQGVLLRGYGIVSLLTAVLFSAAVGTSFNIFLDVAVFLGIVAGLALQRSQRWLAGIVRLARWAPLLLPLLIAQPIVTRLPSAIDRVAHLPEILASLQAQQASFSEAEQFLRRIDGPVLCESLMLCFRAGKALLVDPYNTREMIITGQLPETALLDDIEGHRFAAIELPTMIYADGSSGTIDPLLLHPPRFTDAALHAIARHYERVVEVGGKAIYLPKE